MVTVSIIRADVMSIVEGLSVLVSQHNGNSVPFEQLWASESEQKKLDIYYREAIGDLEQRLKEWVVQTHAQYSLTNDGSNYQLQLLPGNWWPTRLTGLVRNKIQDYIVHAIAAGWFATFAGITVQDYSSIAAQDLTDIHVLLEQQEFNFNGQYRASDESVKTSDETPTSEQRGDDTVKPTEDETASADERGDDSVKTTTEEAPTASERGEEALKPTEDETASAGERGDDSVKTTTEEAPTASERGEEALKPTEDETASAGERGDDSVKTTTEEAPTADVRVDDTVKPTEDETASVGERGDDAMKTTSDEAPTADIRGDDTVKGTEGETASAGERGSDRAKTLSSTELRMSMRRSDNERKDSVSEISGSFAGARHRDDAEVCITHEYTDWSGTDFGRYPDPNSVPTRRYVCPPPYQRGGHTVIPPCATVPRPASACRPAADAAGTAAVRPAADAAGRYWPREDKPWNGPLEEMSHQEQERKNAEYEKQMRAKYGPGIYMEKYRELHDQEFMQEHECSHDDGSHDLEPLDWAVVGN